MVLFVDVLNILCYNPITKPFAGSAKAQNRTTQTLHIGAFLYFKAIYLNSKSLLTGIWRASAISKRTSKDIALLILGASILLI